MSEKRVDEFAPRVERRQRRRGVRGLTFPLILIALGAFFLLQNFGLVSFDWRAMINLWPLLLILIGLDILLKRTAWGSLIVALATGAALLGIFWVGSNYAAINPPSGNSSGQIEERLGGVDRLRVQIDAIAGEIKIVPLAGDAQSLTGEYASSGDLLTTTEFTAQGGVGEFSLTQTVRNMPNFSDLGGGQVTLALPRGIPIELEVTNDIGPVTLDLTGLTMANVDVHTATGSLTVTLPETGSMDRVSLDTDLGAVSVSVPRMASLDITDFSVSSNSGALDVQLPQSGKIGTLDVRTDLGSINVVAPDHSDLDIRSLNAESNSGSVMVFLPWQGTLGEVSASTDLGPVTIKVPEGADTLSLNSLSAKSNSGAVSVDLPPQGTYETSLKTDLGAITLRVPAGLGVRLKVNSSANEADIQASGFESKGDGVWVRVGESAGNQATVAIDGNASSIEIIE
jgi:hypothetical protein